MRKKAPATAMNATPEAKLGEAPKATLVDPFVHAIGMEARYEAYRRDGRLPATYEVCYVHGWGPQPGQPRREQGAEIASFPVERLRIRRKGE